MEALLLWEWCLVTSTAGSASHPALRRSAHNYCGAGGLATGLAFGIACRYALRLIRHLGASLEQQVCLEIRYRDAIRV